MSIECTYSSYNYNPTQHQPLEDEDDEEEEDYIDMEITSFYTAFLHRRSHDFEFSSGPLEPLHIPPTSPADELFSNGKLLPLLSHSNLDPNYDQSLFSTPFATTPISGPTPFESCNASPYVSRELTPKKSNWTKKLKLIKRPSIITSKIKAFKTLFGAKSNPPTNKISDHNPSGEDDVKTFIPHRKSFSGAFTRPRKANTSSSHSSLSPSSKRTNCSRNLENGNAVDGAIAHCKQSHSRRSFKSWKEELWGNQV